MTTAEKLKWCLDRLEECKGNKAALDAAKEAIGDLIAKSDCENRKYCGECQLAFKNCLDLAQEVAKVIPDEAIEAHNELS